MQKRVMIMISLVLALSTIYVNAYTGCEDPNLNTGGKECVEVTGCGDPAGVLDQANTYYLLMNDVHADNSCILINNQDITFDLNGFTIFFGENPIIYDQCRTYTGYIQSGCHQGIAYRSSFAPDWQHIDSGGCNGAEIMNGRILQVSDGAWGSSGILMSCDNVEYHHLEIEVGGLDTQNIYMPWASIGAEIHNNNLIHRGGGVTNRMAIPAQIKQSGQEGYQHIYNNNLTGSPHSGIVAGGDSNHVHNNYISHNSGSENAYALFIRGQYNDFHDNIVNAQNGRGLFIDSSRGNHNLVYNNYIEVRESGTTGAYALRLRYGTTNNSIFNNTIYAHAGQGFGDAYALGITHTEDVENFIYDNSFIATSDGTAEGFALYVDTGPPVIPHNWIFNNYFESNHHVAHFQGQSVGFNFKSISNTFAKGDNPLSDYATISVPGLGSGINNHDHIFIDSRFENGASYDDASFPACNADETCEFTVQWFLDVKLEDASGQPIGGSTVTITDANSVPVVTQNTNSAGLVLATLTEYVNDKGVRTYSSPYTITAQHPSGTMTETLTLDATKTVTFAPSGSSTDDGSTQSMFGAPPPVSGSNSVSISNLECEDAQSFNVCSGLGYSDELRSIRVTCSVEEGSITQAAFTVTNQEDEEVLFTNVVSSGSNGVYSVSIPSLILDESGDHTVSATCVSDEGRSNSITSSWTVPWGTLVTSHTSPTSGLMVTNGSSFLYTTTVACTGGECGTISATLDPIFGNPSTEGSTRDLGANNKRCNIFYLDEEGVLKNLSRYGSASGGQCAMAIYESTDTTPSSLLAESAEQMDSTNLAWNHYDVSDIQLSPGYYALCYICSGDSQYHGPSTGGVGRGSADNYPFDNPFGASTWDRTYDLVFTAGYDLGGGVGLKGIVPVGSGSPFFVTDSNPKDCGTMNSGDTCESTWTVFANGNNATYTFFVDYVSDLQGVNSVRSQDIEITIDPDATSCPIPFDVDCDSCINLNELTATLSAWYQSQITISVVIENIRIWRAGGC